MTLYDTQADVLRKAIMGSGKSPAEIAEAGGMPSSSIMEILSGRVSAQRLNPLASSLSLDSEALVGLPDYLPVTSLPKQVTQLALTFEDEAVNAWLITCGQTHLVIDAGFKPGDLAAALGERRIGKFHLLVTHGHRDHVGGIRAVAPMLEGFHAPAGVDGAQQVGPGDKLCIGPLEIGVVDLRGHHPQAVGFRIDGLDVPLMAVGDAVFAGSIGGCPDPRSFADARESIRAAFADQDPGLILLPGHGPPTTLGEELAHNPFLAGWQSSRD